MTGHGHNDVIKADVMDGVPHTQDSDVGERVYVFVGTAWGSVEGVFRGDELEVGFQYVESI